MLDRAEGPLEIYGDELKSNQNGCTLFLCIAALEHGVVRELDLIEAGVLLGSYDGGKRECEGVGKE